MASGQCPRERGVEARAGGRGQDEIGDLGVQSLQHRFVDIVGDEAVHLGRRRTRTVGPSRGDGESDGDGPPSGVVADLTGLRLGERASGGRRDGRDLAGVHRDLLGFDDRGGAVETGARDPRAQGVTADEDQTHVGDLIHDHADRSALQGVVGIVDDHHEWPIDVRQARVQTVEGILGIREIQCRGQQSGQVGPVRLFGQADQGRHQGGEQASHGRVERAEGDPDDGSSGARGPTADRGGLSAAGRRREHHDRMIGHGTVDQRLDRGASHECGVRVRGRHPVRRPGLPTRYRLLAHASSLARSRALARDFQPSDGRRPATGGRC